jgi:calcium/calmodulin-dependent protein kinase I
MHRDIKPENILLSETSGYPTVKLIDFGLSRLVGPTDNCNVACGTLGYVAPEVLKEGGYGKQVDIWSIGIVLHLMLRGILPFESKD